MTKLMKQRAEVFEKMKTIAQVPAESRTDAQREEFRSLDAQYTKMTHDMEIEARASVLAKDFNTATETADVSDEHRSELVERFLRGDTSVVNELRSLNTYSTAEGGLLVQLNVPAIKDGAYKLNAVRQIVPGTNVWSFAYDVDVGLDAIEDPDVIAQAPSGSYNEKQLTLTNVTLRAYKVGGIVKVSEELVNDTQKPIEALISRKAMVSSDEKEEALFVSGSGTSQTKGLVKYTGGTDTTLGTGSALVKNLRAAQYNLGGKYRNGAVYIVGDTLESQMRQATDTNGQFLWVPSTVEGRPDRFDGKPVYNTSALAGAYATGVVAGVLVNPEEIYINDRAPLTILALRELYSAAGQIGFRYSKRVDMALATERALSRLLF